MHQCTANNPRLAAINNWNLFTFYASYWCRAKVAWWWWDEQRIQHWPSESTNLISQSQNSAPTAALRHHRSVETGPWTIAVIYVLLDAVDKTRFILAKLKNWHTKTQMCKSKQTRTINGTTGKSLNQLRTRHHRSSIGRIWKTATDVYTTLYINPQRPGIFSNLSVPLCAFHQNHKTIHESKSPSWLPSQQQTQRKNAKNFTLTLYRTIRAQFAKK